MAALCHTGLDHDAELMLRVKMGDENAFDVLVRKHRAPILRFGFRRVRDRTAAEDIAQEVFLRVYRYRSDYQATAKFTTWLYHIAGHVASNWIRDHSRARAHESYDISRGSPQYKYFIDRTAPIDEWLILQNARSALHGALGDLPERQRRIVVMHKFEEMKCEEIAGTLGCSPQAIRSTLCRAYSNLRQCLGGGDDHLQPEYAAISYLS